MFDSFFATLLRSGLIEVQPQEELVPLEIDFPPEQKPVFSIVKNKDGSFTYCNIMDAVPPVKFGKE